MHGTTILTAALLGTSSFVSARPMLSQSAGASSASLPSVQPSSSSRAENVASATISMPAGSTSTGGVRSNSTGSSNPSDFKFPLSNGFPNIVNPSAELNAIEKQAQGVLDNNDPPPKPHPDSLASLGFIAFNELFEVAFFTELIQNITTNVAGYGPSDIPDRDEVLRTLQAVVAQEELHELKANGAFNAFTGETIQPCQYKFPVDNFHDAIALASTFTDVVLSTLPDIQTIFAENNDDGLIRGVGSVIGQEGEQNGFYRHILGKLPPALPFLTGGARDFAFNGILQNFVVPNTCPSLDLLVRDGLTQFDVLNVLTKDFTLDDITIDFSLQTSFPAKTRSFIKQTMYLTYINQQNKPFSVGITSQGLDSETGALKFTAPFPGKTHDLNGLTIAAITNSAGPFNSPDDVAAATLFGPGLIEV